MHAEHAIKTSSMTPAAIRDVTRTLVIERESPTVEQIAAEAKLI